MAIKRLTNEELVEKCLEIFYNYMSGSSTYFTDESGITEKNCPPEYPTPMDMVYKEHMDSIEENKARIEIFENALINVKGNKNCEEVLNKQLEYLREEREIFLTTNIKKQKARYKKTKKIDYTRNQVRISLNKEINSFYDDFCIDVAFYDDIGVANGLYDEYKVLKTKEDRLEFIKAHTEVTNLGLVFVKNNRHIATIQMFGKLNTQDRRVQEASITLLDSKFSDFENLTLKETMSISNNDLKQFLQSKIDLDKEGMKLVCSKDIGYDNYKIYRNPEYDKNDKYSFGNNEFYIRYVCPSTGRVYYNALNLRNLSVSEYYKDDDCDSYIDAWWSVTHVGANPYAEPMICL